MSSRYTEAQYRADIADAIQQFPLLDRPLIRLAMWWTERNWGTPDKPGRKGWPGSGQ